MRVVGKDGTLGMCAKGDGNGAFLVAELCGALIADDAVKEGGEREKVKRWFIEGVKEVEEGRAKGKKVLLEKIALL